jgi:hypothetical protein
MVEFHQNANRHAATAKIAHWYSQISEPSRVRQGIIVPTEFSVKEFRESLREDVVFLRGADY